MDTAALILRLALAAMFTVSAVSKLFDRDGARDAAEGFGVPSALSPIVAIALPIVEAAIAIALIPASSAVVGAIAALALLTTFIVVIGVALARGRRPDCHCFGQLHSAPIGPGIVMRNVVLAGAAIVVIAAGGGTSVTHWFDGLSATSQMGVIVGAGLGAIAIAEAAVLWQLFVSYGRLLVRVDGLEAAGGGPGPTVAAATGVGHPIGSTAPPFALDGLHGETITLDALLARNRLVLLLFTDPQCGPCGALVPEIAAWQRTLEGRLTIAVVSRGGVDDNRAKFSAAGVTGVLLQRDRETSESYLSSPTPSGVLIDAGGMIASEAALGADAIRRLVEQSSGVPSVPVVLANGSNGNGNGHGHGHAAAAPVPTLGDPAPEVRLPDLDGRPVELTSFRGRDVLVVFWNPECGFCELLLPELREWETQNDPHALEPVIVTTGSIDRNRALGFRSTVLFDDPFAVGPSFGASGTPIAVVVDADGLIASDLAIGGPAIMELVGRIRA